MARSIITTISAWYLDGQYFQVKQLVCVTFCLIGADSSVYSADY